MERRTFLTLVGQSVAAAPLLGIAACDDPKPKITETPPPKAKPKPREKYQFGFWTAKEQVILGSAMMRLLPGDPATGAPSGVIVGVMEYLDRQMQLDEFKGLHRMMRGGVDFLDRVAKKYHGGPFRSLPVDTQDQILQQFQMSTIPKLKFPQARFFTTLHTFALEGYWGHPKYGGNRDRAVWAWVDINPQCSHIHGSCTE